MIAALDHVRTVFDLKNGDSGSELSKRTSGARFDISSEYSFYEGPLYVILRYGLDDHPIQITYDGDRLHVAGIWEEDDEISEEEE